MTRPQSYEPPGPGKADRISLERLLQDLATWADERGRGDVDALRQRLAARELRVLLIGEAKRGKSTLGNAILGRDLLPAGVRPVTSITTSIGAGSPEQIEVTFADGTREYGPVSDLATYVTERENPRNVRQVRSVHVDVEGSPVSPALLVDTPGVGSVLTHNTDEANRAMDVMDLAVFVLTADPPISHSERRLLEAVRARAVTTFVVLNKIDRLSPEELEDAKAFVAEVTDCSDLFPCSARLALEALLRQDELAFVASGVKALTDELSARVRARAEHDLVRSIGAAAGRAAVAAIERVGITRAALTALLEDRARDVELFDQELARTQVSQEQALAAVAWAARKARRELDENAADRAQRSTSQLLSQLDRLTIQLSSTHGERQAREAVVTLIEHDVKAWRQERLGVLETSLSDLIAMEQDLLNRTAAEVSESARRLLGADLRPVIDPLPGPDLGDFSFDFSPEVGWNTALVQGARRRLPARWRKHAAAVHLHTEAVALVDKQYGRARSDLQRRVEASHRELEREVTKRIAEQRDGLAAALTAATHLRSRTIDEQRIHVEELDHRLSALRRQVERLQDVL